MFRRQSRGATQDVRAAWTHRVSQPLCTSLALPDGSLVRTVEHLLATLSAFGIDNALVELDAEELPIFDGGALPWCRAVIAAGRADQPGQRRAIRVVRPFEHRDGKRLIRIEPAEAFSVEVEIALAHFGALRWSRAVTPVSFLEDLAPSRSFGRLKPALLAKAYGHAARRPLLRGAWPSSTAILWRGRVLGGMRVPQEPVRHRALDLIGDLSLAGSPILGHVLAQHPGHETNQAFLRRLMASDAWEPTLL